MAPSARTYGLETAQFMQEHLGKIHGLIISVRNTLFCRAFEVFVEGPSSHRGTRGICAGPMRASRNAITHRGLARLRWPRSPLAGS